MQRRSVNLLFEQYWNHSDSIETVRSVWNRPDSIGTVRTVLKPSGQFWNRPESTETVRTVSVLSRNNKNSPETDKPFILPRYSLHCADKCGPLRQPRKIFPDMQKLSGKQCWRGFWLSGYHIIISSYPHLENCQLAQEIQERGGDKQSNILLIIISSWNPSHLYQSIYMIFSMCHFRNLLRVLWMNTD